MTPAKKISLNFSLEWFARLFVAAMLTCCFSMLKDMYGEWQSVKTKVYSQEAINADFNRKIAEKVDKRDIEIALSKFKLK